MLTGQKRINSADLVAQSLYISNKAMSERMALTCYCELTSEHLEDDT